MSVKLGVASEAPNGCLEVRFKLGNQVFSVHLSKRMSNVARRLAAGVETPPGADGKAARKVGKAKS